MLEYKGYTGVFEYEPDQEVFAGHVVDLRDQIYFEGESVKELTASLQRAVDHYLQVCERRGDEPEKPFSGKLNVRLGPKLHREIAVAASSRGESINAWITRVAKAAVEEEARRRTPPDHAQAG